jgi:plastocyanin
MVERRAVRRSHRASALAGALVIPACWGGGNDPGPTGDPTESPSRPQPAVSSPEPCSAQTERPFAIAMRDFRFVPPCLVVTVTERFRLRNNGSAKHNLTITRTEFAVDVAPGEVEKQPGLDAAGVEPGTYEFVCRFHESKGMTGELHVLAA